jgi:hypothetical protein
VPRFPNGMEHSPQIGAAKAFARSFNILLKYVRLYGFDHKQSNTQFEIAWREIRSALQGHNGLLLGAAGGKILIDGAPLDMGISEQGFAQTLSTAGISSLQFLPSASANDFEQLVRIFSRSKPATLLNDLQRKLPADCGIHVNSVRFVMDDGTGESSVAQEIMARAIGKLDGAQEWLTDPDKLIQLITAVEGQNKTSGLETVATSKTEATASARGGSGEGMNSAEFQAVLRVLESMVVAQDRSGEATEVGELHRKLTELPQSTEESLQKALAVMAAQVDAGQKIDGAVMLKLAEHLAIRFALDSYERGDMRVNAVREMLERLSSETARLRKILNAHEERMERAGLICETHADILDRQFWAAVPEKNKCEVLLSDEAYCIPARNIRAYVESLLHAGDQATPVLILKKYLECMQCKEEDARKRVAIGLNELADLYGSVDVSLLYTAIDTVAAQLLNEPASDVQALIGATFVRLSQEATTRRDYVALDLALTKVREIEDRRPNIGRDVRPRVAVENRIREFIEDGLHDEVLPAGLIEILKATPRAAIDQIMLRLSNCTRREECERVIEMASKLGTPAADHLLKTLRTGNANEAVSTIGLLSRLNPQELMQELPKRVTSFSRYHQDGVVRQISAAASGRKVPMLVELLSAMDPLIVLLALEELAANSEPIARDRLLMLAEGDGNTASPYLQVRAIETLGRLRDVAAGPALIKLFSARGLFGWEQPKEVRIASAQALLRTNSTVIRSMLHKSDITPAELELAPLEFDPTDAWVRQRRYARITPPESLAATATLTSGKCKLEVKRLSLGGGLAVSERRIPTSSEVMLDMPMGLKHCRSHVLVREIRGHELSFEILDMKLDDRSRLRTLLMQQIQRVVPARHTPAARIATS